ncbi:MAG: glycosyltransferase family 2 protein [Lachnospiraceae bacterium]|nr:glycosyltransferase family 2 protein [Lachnospiraceae bacterium]
MLSVVLPTYNEEQNIEKAYEAIRDVLLPEGIELELIYVNDGSKDESLLKINELVGSVSDVKIVGVSFSRNFGKEAAILAGLYHASGEVCAVMDCDLQHPPETLLSMYRLWEQGYEVIEGVKRSRGRENPIYRGFANLFYKLISKAAGVDMARASDFKMLDRKVVDQYIRLPERNIFFRSLSAWMGYKSISVEFDVKERASGSSKWSLDSLFKYAIGSISSFSTAPMQLITLFGVFFFCFSVVLGIQSLVRWFVGGALEGFTTVILLILMVGSMIMVSLGIIGYYLSRIYEEIKARPRYIVDEVISNSKN